MADEMQVALTALRSKRESKRSELAAIDQAIIQLEQVVQLVDPNAEPISSEYTGISIGDAARRYLEEIGKPATTREIAENLLKKGIKTTSKNFTMTVYAILREMADIKRSGEGAWMLGKKKEKEK